MRPRAYDMVLTEFDRRRLEGLLQLYRRRSSVQPVNLDELELELGRARVVPAAQVPANVVTMNSRVMLRDLASGANTLVSLVFPHARPCDDSHVPVLSPLGLALLGGRAGDNMEWHTTHGLHRVCIDAVLYQPEAAGDFFA